MNSKLWLIFILIQPFLDVATSFMISNFDFPITIGILFRMFFMGIAFLYVTRFFYKEKMKKMMAFNFVFLAFLGANFLINFELKENFVMMAEIQFLAKTAYPLQLFFLFYILLKKEILKKKVVIKALTANLFSISLLIIIPDMLGLASSTYSHYKGTTGWFYSPNEIGAIVAFLFPVVILGVYNKTTEWFGSITIVVASYAAYLIGTKVSLGSVMLVLLISLIYVIWKKNFKIEKVFYAVCIPFFALLVGFNQAPAVSNVESVKVDAEMREQKYQHRHQIEDVEQVASIEERQYYVERSHPILTKILSSRDLYVLKQADRYQEASLVRKLFGMGYADGEKMKHKVTEMDLFDFFFSFGILGSMLVLIGFWKEAVLVVKGFAKQLKAKFKDPFYFFLLLSVGLLGGTSFVAGHVVFAPAASVYFASSTAMLLVITERKQQKKNSY